MSITEERPVSVAEKFAAPRPAATPAHVVAARNRAAAAAYAATRPTLIAAHAARFRRGVVDAKTITNSLVETGRDPQHQPAPATIKPRGTYHTHLAQQRLQEVDAALDRGEPPAMAAVTAYRNLTTCRQACVRAGRHDLIARLSTDNRGGSITEFQQKAEERIRLIEQLLDGGATRDQVLRAVSNAALRRARYYITRQFLARHNREDLIAWLNAGTKP